MQYHRASCRPVMPSPRLELDDFFDQDGCRRCGTCLSECPVLRIPRARAGAEMGKMIRGEHSEVLDRCAICLSCDQLCPRACSPSGLVLYRWFERRRRRGIPAHVRSALPAERHNFIHFARGGYDPEETSAVRRWQENLRRHHGGREIVFAGCNAQIFPYLLCAPLFSGTRIIGAPGLCCGELYYRMGLLDQTLLLGRRLREAYRRLAPKRVIVPCMAGYNLQKTILPRQFGIHFSTEIVYLGDWLLEMAEREEIRFTNPLERRVAVQDSCHGKQLGEAWMDKPRQLLRLAGAEIVELTPDRNGQICCGAAEGITRFDPMDVLGAGLRQWSLASAAGAELLSPYCATCLLMLSTSGMLFPSSIGCFHLVELISLATGQPMRSLARPRARRVVGRVILSSAWHLLRSILPWGASCGRQWQGWEAH